MMLFIETFYANPLLKFLVDTTMKSIVIFAVARLLAFYFRHKSAAVRGFVWGMAIVGFLIVPLFSFILPKWEVKVLPETPIIRYETPQLVEISRPAAAPVLIAPSQLTTKKVSSTQVSPTPPQPEVVTQRNSILPIISWTNWIGIVWACVSIFFLARLIVGICAVWHVSVRANDISSTIDQPHLNWNRQFSVRLSDRIKMPMMWGIFRPVILLPTDAANWQTDRLRAVLLHETAHIKRWDWLTQTIAQITCATYWFNPFVWFTAHRIRTEAEQACDDQVLNTGYQSTDYARHLLNITRDVKLANTISRTAVAMARSSRIEGRLRTVLTENLNRHPVTKAVVGIGLLILTCFTVPIGVLHLAQAVDSEKALYQQIQEASKSQPTPEEMLPKPRVYGQESGLAKYQQNWEQNLELCEQFLIAYPDSERYDTVWFEKLNYLFGLQRYAKFDTGAEAFLSELPTSRYIDRLRRFRVYRFMDEGKFDQALAELDKIVDPAMLPEVHQRKADVYDEMDNSEKANEFNMLWTELILGKSAPKFSHTSVDGTPVLLQDFRGKVVLFYYWSAREATTEWMVPMLKRLYNMHHDSPDFALINICTRSSKTEMTQFIEKHAMPGIHLHLEPEAIPPRFGIINLLNYLPRYVILDKTGIVRENGNTFWMGDFKIEHLVTALLAEGPKADNERIIPQVNQFLASSYLRKGQIEKSIAEYEKILAFTPNNLDIMMAIFNLEMFPGARTALINRAYDRMLELHKLNQKSPELGLNINYHILELVKLFAAQGDQEKIRKLFQIAVTNHSFETINYVLENKERFALLQDTPEFHKFLTEAPPEQKPNETRSDDPGQAQQNVEICKHHLLEIGKAIQAYQKEHGEFPEWLSDLYPKYLPNADTLLCPADEDGGKPYYLVNTDPKMSMSYDYQFHPQYRKDKTEERLMYGDVLPLVRCRHHENQPFECHNLSFAFKIYWSSGPYKPDEMYETVEEAIEALENGLQRQADNERFFHFYTTLARFYIEVGREKDVEDIVNRFKSVMNPDSIADNFRLGTILEISNQPKETLKVFEKLEKRDPDNYLVLDELARIHERLGNSELAEEYRDKADPMSALVGKVVPDFSATDIEGKPISLEQYRGKVVLLDFWAVWCGPCISEMPNVKRVYNTYKDQGFEIIGVSLDTDEVRLRNYLKANDIPWHQIFSGQKWNSPLAKQYHIRSIPAPWLIARDGTLISREARGIELEQLVVEALKTKPK